MPTIYVENVPYEIEDGQNLLHACLSLKFDIPYFCWHPAMGSVGACRMCAVKQFKDESDTRGRIVMSCMTPAQDGARLSIADPEVSAFRESVIEWLMLNHPHDCPICDEGGECHLQDMTYMSGHVYRRYRFKKRTYPNQYLGPFINHEMNRCIQCYRCVRFYDDYARGHDLHAFAAHDHVYFGRHEDGVLELEFSGNLVEVCPTGVFTDKTLKRHYTRKWDLQTAPSVCVHCSVGCNTIPGERYDTIRRIRNRYNSQVNGYFLCDRGRYGYEFVNSARRIGEPLLRGEDGELRMAGKEEALQRFSNILAESAGVVGVGSPRASLEANFALRALVGPERFCMGVSRGEAYLTGLALHILQGGPARSPSLNDVGQCDAVLVLGEDTTNTGPMLTLALRQAVLNRPRQIAGQLGIPGWQDAAVREAIQHARGPLFVATPAATKLDEQATWTYRAAPDDIARLGFAAAHALNVEAPAVPDLPGELGALAETIADALREAERPLVVSGASLGSEAILHAAANMAWALSSLGRPADLCMVVPECNSLGLAMLGGGDLEAALEALQDGTADTLVILENDLYRRADAAAVEALFAAARRVIVLDHLHNPTTARADVVLPASTFAEGDGTLVNNEGRAQRYYQVYVPHGAVQESWRWLRDVMLAAGRADVQEWQTLDGIMRAMAGAVPAFQAVPEIAPPAGFRLVGQKIPRQPHRYSGRTAIVADRTVHEPEPPEDPDAPFTFSMEGYQGLPPSSLIREYWAPNWNSVQALNKLQREVGGPLLGGDPGRRLVEPAATDRMSYFARVPAAFSPQDGEWLVVPLYHIFGSEELSLLAPGIAELAPEPYVALNPEDLQRLQVSEGQAVSLFVGEVEHRLPVRLEPSLPPGVAGLMAGLPGLPASALPRWGRFQDGEAP
jgi:NADH-quinone oxidoreductase subunit G